MLLSSIHNTLIFNVDIMITEIGDIYGEKIKKSNWGQYGIMHNDNHRPPLRILHERGWSMEVNILFFVLETVLYCIKCTHCIQFMGTIETFFYILYNFSISVPDTKYPFFFFVIDQN